MVSTFGRTVDTFLTPSWQVNKYFPKDAMDKIVGAIEESEKKHCGEVCFFVEAALPLVDVLRGITARQRAVKLFSKFRIWDTKNNNGVLIYLLLAEKNIEIVADREIISRLGQEKLESVCHLIEVEFKKGLFLEGILFAINELTNLLAPHFPPEAEDTNELPDQVRR